MPLKQSCLKIRCRAFQGSLQRRCVTLCFRENLTASDRRLDALDDSVQETTDRVETVNNRIEAIKGLVDQLKVMADELQQNATAIKELDVSGILLTFVCSHYRVCRYPGEPVPEDVSANGMLLSVALC